MKGRGRKQEERGSEKERETARDGRETIMTKGKEEGGTISATNAVNCRRVAQSISQ